MQSSGGVAAAAEAARGRAPGASSPGPPGGAVGAGLLAAAARRRQRARLRHGRHLLRRLRGRGRARCGGPTRARSTAAPIQLPMVDVHTVGAGGGSIGWRDRGGALRVGPRSAGAEPGPGLLRPRRDRADRHRRQPAARLPRRRLAARRRGRARRRRRRARGRARSATRSASSELETAEGIVRVANQEMVRALRVVTVERGVDPRGFALLPFGGAGPMHAAAIAAELGIDADPLPARQRRPLGARPLRLRAPPRHRPHGDARAASELTAERIAAEVGGAARAARRRARGRRARGRLRAALPRPGVRAPGPGPPSARPRRAGRALRAPSTSAATATATPTARSCSSRSGSPLVAPGPEPRPRGGRRRRRRARARAGRASAASGSRRRSSAASRAAGSEAEGPCVFELPEATLVAPARLAGRGRRGRHDRRGASERVSGPAARPDHAAGADRRAAGRLRRDGRGADPLRLLGQHQGAPRLLDRALRRRAASWSCRPSTSRSTSARCPTRSPPSLGEEHRDRATSGSSTTPTAAAPTCPTSP